MDLNEVKAGLASFGASLLEFVEKELCEITKTQAEKLVEKLTHIDQLNDDQLVDTFADLGKSLFQKFLGK